jgi:predicted DNA-binding protein
MAAKYKPPKMVGRRASTSIYLRPEVLEALQLLAGKRDVPVAQLMREAIDRFLDQEGQLVVTRERSPDGGHNIHRVQRRKSPARPK